MIQGLENMLSETFKNLEGLRSQLTPKQRVELAKFENKSKSLFKGVDLQNPDLDLLAKKQKEIEKLSKNIQKWA